LNQEEVPHQVLGLDYLDDRVDQLQLDENHPPLKKHPPLKLHLDDLFFGKKMLHLRLHNLLLLLHLNLNLNDNLNENQNQFSMMMNHV
jgi:hypothetical protein